ncbi:serine/threonine protein kinase [Pseudacidovorax intermedius]|uniref:Serine/threonine protein kinase n=1 Tax=Pseudacidovorax intermedius TaxID=433924 RepID=A0A370FP14_9BURK|nr:serine/threonine-protein kinase [Pseudacidovorax intermedius]RDI29476.1 serine/threonine protein kinase [Pseudacidovorax intermedius]
MSDPRPDEPTRVFGGGAPGPDEATRVVTGAAAGDATRVLTGGGAPAGDATRVVTGSILSPTQPRTSTGAGSAPAGGGDAGTLPPGSAIAEFEITRLIGQGGFGVVYEAWDHTLERVVAIKEYLPTSLATRTGDGTIMPLSERHRETFDLGMRSFINEARLLAQFDHPSLLKVYRFWQERGTTYMVMPFYRGDTLRQALADIPAGVDEGWLLRVMDGVSQALAVMHAANCFHRDIAPDNILLLEGSGRPVVLDFGAARRVISDKTQAITVILKPGYAPVEQYAEMPDMKQGPWTDVYALAAVMHVAICGRAPPPSVARILSDSYVPLAGNEQLLQRYSPAVLAAVDAGLAVRPEGRPQSMAEFRQQLGLEETTTIAATRGAPAGGAAPAVARTPVAGRTQPPRSAPAPAPVDGAPARSKLVPVIGGVAALAVAAGAALWWSGRGDGASAPPPATVAQAPVADAPAAVPAPAPPEPPPRVAPKTPLESLQALSVGATPGFDVTASARKAEVTIGKDKLAFDVRSNRDGFVYVFLLASGGELFQLFPNLLDRHNRITAGSTMALPRASWPMEAGGPPGTNHFAVVVSERERDFSDAGMKSEGVFPLFPAAGLASLEAANPGPAATVLLGRPVCPQSAGCADAYGVGSFKIVEK